jgi:branched-subunit amino acid transport protein
MNIWLIMILSGLITYGIRLSFIQLFGKIEVPLWLGRALRFVPPAVLSAIIFPELLLPSGSLDISLSNLRLFAGMLAAFVAWRTKNVVLTIAVGMAALLILQALIP